MDENNYPLLSFLNKRNEWQPNSDLPSTLESNEWILDNFIAYTEKINLKLYPAQEEAILEIFSGNNVILNTPTGSGKSLVALFLHFKAMALGKRSFYTCPIKALVNEKFISLCYEFGPDSVGLITGDATVNASAPIVCCTAEILANMALRQGELTEVDEVVIDEFHYYADRERGVAWQIPLLTLPKCRFLLMSATMGDTSFFVEEISKFTQVACKTILSAQRPVPLEFSYEEYPLEMIIEKLIQAGKAPIYLVNFTQRECATMAQALTCVNYCSKEEKQKIAEMLNDSKAEFPTPYGKDVSRLLRHGVGIHHAGLLPRYRLLVEKLAQAGLLKIICGTDSLGVGINVPIRTVLFTKLCKYNGEKVAILTAREFHQISGRAGRKGFDESGTVVVMAPAYIIENKMNEEKAKQKGKSASKVNKAKAPTQDRNFVMWRRSDYERLLNSPPEPLKSSFKVSHSMLLNVLSRSTNGCKAMKDIIKRCHESDHRKQQLRREAWMLFRSLVDRKIVEFVPRPSKSAENNYETENVSPVRLNLSLQEDFSLHHALSLFLVDAINLIDPYSEDYALRVLTLAESIIENPEAILNKQLDRVKRDKLFELKEQGVDYEQRMEELEKLEYPKPDKDFIYNTFNSFKAQHPWLGDENIRPKSIAREMYETFQSFNDYIKEYGIERSEGLLLRYLSDVYRVLTQTIPENVKTEPLMDLISYFEIMLREVDSSLLEEWERIKDPISYGRSQIEKEKRLEKEKLEQGILADMNDFMNKVRNAIFRLVRFLAFDQVTAALECIENKGEWEEKLDHKLDEFYKHHSEICITPNARNKNFTIFEKNRSIEGETGIEGRSEIGREKLPESFKNQDSWQVYQRLVDPEGDNDWELHLEVPLLASKDSGRPLLILKDFRMVT